MAKAMRAARAACGRSVWDNIRKECADAERAMRRWKQWRESRDETNEVVVE